MTARPQSDFARVMNVMPEWAVIALAKSEVRSAEADAIPWDHGGAQAAQQLLENTMQGTSWSVRRKFRTLETTRWKAAAALRRRQAVMEEHPQLTLGDVDWYLMRHHECGAQNLDTRLLALPWPHSHNPLITVAN